MSSPGVLLLCDFVQAADATPGKGFSGFLDYQDRPEAFEVVRSFDGDRWTLEKKAAAPGQIPSTPDAFSGYLEYQDRRAAKPITEVDASRLDPKDITAMINSFFDPGDKSDGIFDAVRDRLSPEEMKNYHEIYDHSQSIGCPMYRGVISFDNNFLREEGLMFNNDVEKRQLKDITRAAVHTLIDKSHLELANTHWTAAIHYNTKNVHVHFSIVENEKVRRRYDRLPLSAIDASKSKVVNQCIGSEQSILRSKLLREDLLPAMKNTYRDNSDILIRLMDQLPAEERWEYNRQSFGDYRAVVNAAVDELIKADPDARAAYDRYVDKLQENALQLRRFYGDGSRELWKDFVPDRIQEFYSRAGNSLLKELQASPELSLDELTKDMTPNQAAAIRTGIRDGIDVTAIVEEEIPASRAWDYLDMKKYDLPDDMIRDVLDRQDPRLVDLVSWVADAGADPAILTKYTYSEDQAMLIAVALRNRLDVSSIADPSADIRTVRSNFDSLAVPAKSATSIELVDFDAFLSTVYPTAEKKATAAAAAAAGVKQNTSGKDQSDSKQFSPRVRASENQNIPVEEKVNQNKFRAFKISTSSVRTLYEREKVRAAPSSRAQSARMAASCRTASRRLQKEYERNLRRLVREYEPAEQRSR